jgi:hypothetical protein
LPNFNPLYVMKLLDKEDKRYITKYDIQRFTGVKDQNDNTHPDSKFGLLKIRENERMTDRELIDSSSIDIMVSYFDIDKDGCLKYDEMMFVLLP